MDGRLPIALVMGATQLFAINRHYLSVGLSVDGLHPAQKTALKLLGLELSKDPSKRIVGRNAVG